MKIKNVIKKFCRKVKEFFTDEWAGNMVEYALLIGFALFMFFLIVNTITSMLTLTMGKSEDLIDIFNV